MTRGDTKSTNRYAGCTFLAVGLVLAPLAPKIMNYFQNGQFFCVVDLNTNTTTYESLNYNEQFSLKCASKLTGLNRFVAQKNQIKNENQNTPDE